MNLRCSLTICMVDFNICSIVFVFRLYLALPSIEMVPSGIIYAIKGQRLEFSCFTQSASVVRKWSTKCSASLPHGVFEDPSGKLTFLDVKPCHSGIYTCELSNPGGSVSQDIILAVDLTKCRAFIDYVYMYL